MRARATSNGHLQDGPDSTYNDLTSQQKAMRSSSGSHLSALKEQCGMIKSNHEEKQEKLKEDMRSGSPMYNKHIQERQKVMREKAWHKLNSN